MAKEPMKANFLGIALPDNPLKPYPPEIDADGHIKILPESAEKLRAAIIKNLYKKDAG